MKICHVITRLIVGGAQENTLLTCKGLHDRGHDVTLLIGPDVGPEGSLVEKASQDGYRIRTINAMHRSIRPLDDLRAGLELTNVYRKLQPDIVHTHSSKAGIVGRWAARRAKVPVVVHTVHGMSFNRTQSAYIRNSYRLLERIAAPWTDHFITVADAMTQQMIDGGVSTADRYTTIHSGMRTDWYDPSRYDRAEIRRSFGASDDDVVVMSVARLFANKGYEQLIPAMAKSVQAVPNLRFVWIGDGPHREDYERQLESLNLRSRVHLTGLVEPHRVAELLAGGDMLTHASQWEGLPRAVVQSLLMGKPAISFDIDGAPEVVTTDKTGCIVPLNDIDAMADAMIDLASDTAKREALGRNGRTRCLKMFDHNLMVDRIEALCCELLSRR